MASIRKTKKKLKRMADENGVLSSKIILKTRVQYRYGISTNKLYYALVWLSYIREGARFNNRLIRNPRFRARFANPNRYGKHKKS